MPEVVARTGLAGTILQHHELRVIRVTRAAGEWVRLDGAEVLGERNLRRRRQRLTTNGQYDVVEKGPADEIHAGGVQRLGQVHATDLRAQRRSPLAYF